MHCVCAVHYVCIAFICVSCIRVQSCTSSMHIQTCPASKPGNLHTTKLITKAPILDEYYTKLKQIKALEKKSTHQNEGHVDRPHLSNGCGGSKPISHNSFCMPPHSIHHPMCESGLQAQHWGNTQSSSAFFHSSGQCNQQLEAIDQQ